MWNLLLFIWQTVQQRGAAVIKARKLSSAMSAAKAICDHMRDIWFGTKEVSVDTEINASSILFYFIFLVFDNNKNPDGQKGKYSSRHVRLHQKSFFFSFFSRQVAGFVVFLYIFLLTCYWCKLIEAVTCLQGEFVSMGVYASGNSYNIPEDLIYSFPVQIKVNTCWTLK